MHKLEHIFFQKNAHFFIVARSSFCISHYINEALKAFKSFSIQEITEITFQKHKRNCILRTTYGLPITDMTVTYT